MSASHTPGPWWMDTGTDGAVIHNDVTIASIPKDAAAWEANAKLIAAAPKLLESAEMTLIFCDLMSMALLKANDVETARDAALFGMAVRTVIAKTKISKNNDHSNN